MTITTVDAAAQAAIGAAARELHLPTVRAESNRLAEIAVRERLTHLGYLAEVLSAEVDDRAQRRRTRRISEAKYPRIKRLSEFNVDAVAAIPSSTLAHLATGAYMTAGGPNASRLVHAHWHAWPHGATNACSISPRSRRRAPVNDGYEPA